MKKLFILLFLISAFEPLTSQKYSQYLIAYWSFDDSTANDHSGHGYNGTIMNSPQPVLGHDYLKTAFHFIGRGVNETTGDHILLPRIPFESFSEFTLTLWAKEEGMSEFCGEPYIFFGDHTGGWLGIFNHCNQHDPNDRNMYIEFSVGADIDYIQPITCFFPDSNRYKWNFYCMTYKNGVLTGYINGKRIKSINQTIRIFGNNSAMARHWWLNGSVTSSRYIGSIDEVKIFNIALDDSDVVNEYKQFKITARSDVICEGDTVSLTADDGYANYRWSTGQNTRTIVVNQSGKYSVSAYLDSVRYNADFTVSVRPSPKPKISVNSFPCDTNSPGVLTVNGNYRTVLWSNGGHGSSTSVTKSGKYYVTVADSNGCYGTDSINISVSQHSKIKLTSTNYTICAGDTVTLTAEDGYEKYQWFEVLKGKIGETGSLNKFVISKAGHYYVLVRTKDSCDVQSDTVDIEISTKSNYLTIEGFSGDKFMDFGSASYGQLICKNLRLHNITASDYVLNNATLFRNLCFSVPQSQFALIIPANGFKDLVVCGSPSDFGSNRDTLLIPDLCSNHNVPLVIFGLRNDYSALAGCNVKLMISSEKYPSGKGIIAGKPELSIMKGLINIPYNAFSTTDDNFNIEVYLTNTIGSVVIPGKSEPGFHFVEDNFYTESGLVSFDIDELESGIYFYRIIFAGSVQTGKVIIVK